MTPLYGKGSSVLKAAEPLQEDSFIFAIQCPDVPGTHLIDIGRIEDRVNLGANE